MLKDIKETAINFDDESDYATYFVSQKKFINKLVHQAEQYPNDVKIKAVNPDGSIVAYIPKKWFKPPAPPKQMSASQKEAASERFKKYHKRKENNYV